MIETAETQQITRLMKMAFLAGKSIGQSMGSDQGKMMWVDWFEHEATEDVRRDVQRVAGQMVSEEM